MTDFTTSDPRCLAVLAKLARARDRMKRLGIKSLLEGRPAWQRMNPMGQAEQAKVIDFKRGRR
jgi:hypothetical protein